MLGMEVVGDVSRRSCGRLLGEGRNASILEFVESVKKAKGNVPKFQLKSELLLIPIKVLPWLVTVLVIRMSITRQNLRP